MKKKNKKQKRNTKVENLTRAIKTRHTRTKSANLSGGLDLHTKKEEDKTEKNYPKKRIVISYMLRSFLARAL